MIGPTNANPKNTVLTDNVQTISAVKTFSASPTVPDTPANTHSAVNQAYVESTVDGINNLVHKTGNEKIAGAKTFTSASPIRMISTANYNALYLASKSWANSIVIRNYADEENYDEQGLVGTTYATATTNNFNIRAYAPRTVKGDTTEEQCYLTLGIHIENNDTGVVSITFNKKDGTSVTKTLGTFDGTSWS